MPNTVITGPILDSFGQPVNGYLYGAQTARSVDGEALVTQTIVKGRVVDGTPFLDDGVTPLEVPPTVVDAEAFEWVEDFRPYRKQVVRYTTIPAAGPVSYANLQDVKQPTGATTWIVPGWARELVDANAGIAASVAHVDAVKTAIDTTVDGFGEAVTEAQETIAEAAAEVESFAGTNNEQVAAMATAPGPLRTVLNNSYVTPVLSAVLTRDSAGRVMSALEDGVTVTYTRDSAGRVATATKNGKTTTYTRDPNGRVSGWSTV